MNESILSPTVRKLAQQCDSSERRAVLAYCCYLTFADRQLRQMETRYVRALAEELGVDPSLPAELARKARRGKLRIKMPPSRAARSLLFHVAIEAASIDGELDDRENNAVRTLAAQLQVDSDVVDAQLSKLTPAKPTVIQSPQADVAQPQPAKGFFAGLLDLLTANMVLDDYEAKLYEPGALAGARKFGEIEYTRTKGGRIELEVELKHLPTPLPSPLTLVIAGQPICDIQPTHPRHDQTFTYDETNNPLPTITDGAIAEIRSAGKVMFRGEFRAD